MRIFRLTLLTIVALALLSGCRNKEGRVKRNSAYYWSTTFGLDSTQREFIAEQRISRIYLRYFDVVVDENGQVMPNATVRFDSPRPTGVEIIPTVFIMNDCMMKDVSLLDSLILQRVLQMNETHDIDSVREIQIDCDWTRRSHDTYFSMLERLKKRAAEKGVSVSTTIRLHQLSEAPPPVDRGVLMAYNTGDVTDLNHNPILEMEAAGPYLRHLSGYRLPLSAAYPAFGWDILIRNGKFVGIVHGDDDIPILPDDSIARIEVPLKTVTEVHDAVGRHNPRANDEIILFDISKQNIINIKNNHYEKIYHH